MILSNKLSTVIITKNEAANIERCLLSVLDFSDEIIVIDDFSVDETPAICKRHNVRFVQNKFVDFAAQKNVALAHANFSLVFSIDADEAVSDELKSSIQVAKSTSSDAFFSMNRKTNYLGKWINYSGWYPDTKIRLWQKEKAQWLGTVHEVLFPQFRDIQHDHTHNFDGMTAEPVSLDDLLATRERLARELQQGLDDNERRFLLSLVSTEPEWSLLGIDHLDQLPAIRWKLQNLEKLKKNNPKKFAEQAETLAERLDALD